MDLRGPPLGSCTRQWVCTFGWNLSWNVSNPTKRLLPNSHPHFLFVGMKIFSHLEKWVERFATSVHKKQKQWRPLQRDGTAWMSRSYVSGSFPQMLRLRTACRPFLQVTDGGSPWVWRGWEIFCTSDPYSSSGKKRLHHCGVFGQCDHIDFAQCLGAPIQVNTQAGSQNMFSKVYLFFFLVINK